MRNLVNGVKASQTFTESMRAKAEGPKPVFEAKGEDVVETVVKALDSLGMNDQKSALAYAKDRSKDMEVNADTRAIYKLVAAMMSKF